MNYIDAHVHVWTPDIAHYPLAARRLLAQGTTLLKVRVLESGRAGEIQVEESAGRPDLDEAAREAVGRWRFLPGKENGKPIPLWVLIPIQFRMGR